MKASVIIAADAGNSRVKILAGKELRTLDYRASDADIATRIAGALKEILLENGGNVSRIIPYSSVNEQAYNLFSSAAASLGFEMLDVAQPARASNIIDFNDISGIGSDRVLGLLGAASITAPPFITIDCGTALTINAVDKDGKCVGGFILPGPFLQIGTLVEKTANLRDVALYWEHFSPGKTTEQAIRQGVIHGISGGATQIVERILENSDFRESSVFLTGGGAELIRNELKDRFNIIEYPNLVCEGILFIANNIIDGSDANMIL